MSLANEESRAAPRNRDNGAGKLYFVKGLKKADEMPDILRGIDREQGCIVVVRPDQYVAHVLPLDARDELTAFFGGFLR